MTLASIAVSLALVVQTHDHPRVLFVESELAFLRTKLSDPLVKEAWNQTKLRADNPEGKDIVQDYDFLDIRELANAELNTDSNDIMAFGIAYALNGNSAYADNARDWFANIVDHVDVSYQSGLEWYDSILWDVQGVRLAVAVDLVWNTMSSAEQADAAAWFRKLADSVKVLHTLKTSGGYYKKNFASGNIKSWNNALFGTVGYLIGDHDLIHYAFEDPANFIVREGVSIEMHFRSKIRNDIVEEPTGPNSQYGLYRTVDWYQAVEYGEEYTESISFQQNHQKANELLNRAALRNGLDLYHFGARSFGTDGRHHPLQPIERAGLFSTLSVPAVDNQWRTWDGSQWVYGPEDVHQSGRGCVEVASFCDEVGAAGLDGLRERLLDIIEGHLIRRTEWYGEFHILRWAWPLQLINQLQGGVPQVGDLAGTVAFGDTPTGDTELTLFRLHPGVGRIVRTPIEVDADGVWDVQALAADDYWGVGRSPGFQSTLAITQVVAGQTTNVAIALEPGEHEVLPRSADYVSRQSIAELSLRHTDPQGIDPSGQLYVFLDQASGGYLDLVRATPTLFTVEQNDGIDLVLKLDGTGLLALLGEPQELSLWWVVLDSSGNFRVADGRYLFND